MIKKLNQNKMQMTIMIVGIGILFGIISFLIGVLTDKMMESNKFVLEEILKLKKEIQELKSKIHIK